MYTHNSPHTSTYNPECKRKPHCSFCEAFLFASAGMPSILTRECDVKASVGVGVVSQELQTGHVSAGCDGRRQDVAGEGAQDRRFSLREQKQKVPYKKKS